MRVQAARETVVVLISVQEETACNLRQPFGRKREIVGTDQNIKSYFISCNSQDVLPTQFQRELPWYVGIVIEEGS